VIFAETPLKGAYIIDLERCEDDRGFFARSWCGDEARKHGLNPRVAQCNVSFNSTAGTLRGLHYQAAPCQEAKLVRCTRGSVFDVIVDLRPDSPTFRQHVAVVLTADNRKGLYVPEDFAHGFLTLEDATEVFYQMSEAYAPEYARGVRWNDPAFAIPWPSLPQVISERDRSYPDWRAAR
jgi:dTDP-4-dehydrorhamnose 3,5-epimerase